MENNEQKALRWEITKTLSNPYLYKSNGKLNSDLGYTLSNHIAKYTLNSDTYHISNEALKKLSDVDLMKTYKRGEFYGKDKIFIYEHSIPASVIRNKLIDSDRTESTVKNILENAGKVVMILRTEDNLLREAKLNSKMTDGWELGDDYKARYNKVGIKVSNQKLKVNGAIKR